jgi:hypothetical protein
MAHSAIARDHNRETLALIVASQLQITRPLTAQEITAHARKLVDASEYCDMGQDESLILAAFALAITRECI